jgi:hypothetical protein
MKRGLQKGVSTAEAREAGRAPLVEVGAVAAIFNIEELKAKQS